MILYAELTKLEPQGDGAIRVHGVASTGARDGAGETVSPDAIRKALPAYMAFPAIREMHQPKAAGAALHAEVDEEGNTRIVARVVDPVAVKKVKAGVYKGLSIGGKVLARDPDDPTRITEVRLDEISLVDRPCNPEAVIDLWKAAVAQAPRGPTNEAVRTEAERMAKAAGRPGRRNDYVAAARAKLTGSAGPGDLARNPAGPIVLDPAHPGAGRDPGAPPSPDSAPNLDPGLRRGTREQQTPAPAFVQVASPPSPDSDERRRDHSDLAKLLSERDELLRSLSSLAAEVERLKAEPLPPRTAASSLAKGVDKTEDVAPRSPDGFADALAALPANERAHMIMKAALARPIAL